MSNILYGPNSKPPKKLFSLPHPTPNSLPQQIKLYHVSKTKIYLTLSLRRPLSYRNQSIDLRSKSTGFYMITGSVMKGLNRYLEIYIHLLPKCFKNAVLERQEMAQCKYFFWHQNRNMFTGKFVVKSEKVLTMLRERMLFSMSSDLSFIKWLKFLSETVLWNVWSFLLFC